MNSSDYWHEREEKSRKNHIKEEREYQKEVDRIYKQMMDSISDQIYAFYAKYATEKGLTMSEVKKKCSKLDMEQFSRKVKDYVKNKDFSENANDEMKLYNLTMKVNRLLLLQANIGLELVDGHDKLEKFYKEKLEGRTIEEIERQAGILGITIQDNKKLVNSIVNASFYNARFSDRVWMYQDLLKADLDKILKTALIQGRNPREFISQIRKKFNSTSSQAFRLLVTELARVQTDAQMKSYIKNGFEEYEFISLGNACDICKALDGKHFKVEKSSPGDNMPPMHPHCRCSTAPYMDKKEYYDWLDSYKEHGLSFDEWKSTHVLEHGSYSGRVNRVGTNKVNLDLIKSSKYRNKFNRLTKNSKVNDAVRRYAQACLSHRGGTDGEDSYIIEAETGKLILRKVTGKEALGVEFTKDELKYLREFPKGSLIGIHNHPTNVYPTGSDFVAAGSRGYLFGIVVTHDGRLFKYNAGKTPFTPELFDKRVEKYMKSPYNEDVMNAHKKVLNEFREEYGITWEEIK